MARSGILCLVGLSAALAGCSEIQPVVAYPKATAEQLSAEATFEQEGQLLRLRQQDGRVATIAYRLSTANVELCTDRAPAFGWVLQSAQQYGPRLRPTAERLFHLDARPAVEAVVAGGPADKAGLRAGDNIVAVEGRALATPAPSDTPTYAAVEALQAQLGALQGRDRIGVTVSREGRALEFSMSPAMGCAYDVQVTPSREMGASADGRHVFVTTAVIRYVGANDEDLAVVLGHEYAHDVLHHKRRLDEKGVARDVIGALGSAPWALMTAEKEADYVGLYLTARAGYDISRGPEFWRQFAADYGDALYISLSHPGSMERATAMAATRDEILAKQKAGQPLAPTPASAGASPK